MASNVRISDATHRKLRDLAAREHAPLQTVVERAIEDYRRNRFLDTVNAQFAALKADGETWTSEAAEREEWDATTADGHDRE
jgi:predicted transcriptional regulator